MKLKYSFLLLITLLTLNACKQIQALKCKNIARFEMVSASLKETQINLDLIIENPNAFTVDIKKIRCVLYKDDQQIGTVKSDSLMHFIANKETTISLNTRIESKKVISNAIDMLLNANQTVRFKIIGTAAIGRGNVFITIPVQYTIDKKWNELMP